MKFVPPFQGFLQRYSSLQGKSIGFALVQAILLSVLFWAVVSSDFERLNLKATAIKADVAGFTGSVSVSKELPGRGGPWILFLRVRCEEKRPRATEVFLNGEKLGDIRFGLKNLEEISLDVPESTLVSETNDIEVSGVAGDWKVEEIRLQNYFGYASGLFNLILIPGSVRAYGRLSWLGLGALFLALLFLLIVRAGLPKVPWIKRADRLFKTLFVVLLAAAAVLPLATKYRLLTSANRLWVFVVLLNFAATFAILKAFFLWVRTGFEAQTLDSNPRKKRIVSLVLPAVIGLFFLSSMLGILRHFGGNYSRFLRIEEKRIEAFGPLYFPPDRAAEIRAGLAPLDGYDGEFNYFMAFDPFLSKYKNDPRIYSLFIDEPAYRFGRIGFPLLVKLFSLDNPRLFPKAIVWLIVASHFFGAFFLLRIILFFKKNPFWTFLYILVPGFYYSLQWGLGESIGMVLVLAALYAYLKERIPWTAALLAASLFIRESGFLAALAIMIFELFRRRDIKRAVFIGSSIVPYLLWKGFLTYRLFEINGWKTFILGPADFALPFSGFFDLFAHIRAGGYDRPFVSTAVIYSCLLSFLFVFSLVLFFKKKNVLSLSLLLFSALSVSLNYPMVWIGIGGAIRLTTEAFVFLIPAYLMQRDSLKPSSKYLFAGFFAVLFVFDFFVMDISGYFRSAFLIW
ncbi:MAG: hypothetical protein NTU60_07380 [Candidatus Aminicenantes bacterium]|nr:hypothetical protein [Candidatus Aminicenantes bacterium]